VKSYGMWKSDWEKQQEEFSKQLRREGCFWLLLGAATLVLLTLGGCGGGAGALPFAAAEQPQESTQPVTCAAEGCAK
jgi:hypothetical protein